MSEAEEAKTMAQVKRIIRRKLRHQPTHQDTSLNIYPLMDVMTILLVFMIMQFAQEAAAIVQGPTLQIPWSSSDAELADALPIQISYPSGTDPGTITVGVPRWTSARTARSTRAKNRAAAPASSSPRSTTS